MNTLRRDYRNADQTHNPTHRAQRTVSYATLSDPWRSSRFL
jgi:hypothetical protein